MKAPQTINIGRARVRLLNLGTLLVDLTDWFGAADAARTPELAALLALPAELPMLVVLIVLPETIILVDACDPLSIAESSYAEPGYQPPPDLDAQLAAAGIAPAQIEHVVLTHLHFDHISGVSREQSGRLVACFPRAQHYVGRSDWRAAQEDMRDPATLEHRTLAVIERDGLVRLADQHAELCPEVSVLAAPGETPGHQIVRVHSNGQTLYCLGDLYHHAVEIEWPELVVPWADPAAMRRSRDMLVAAALAEDAVLTASHIPGFGPLRPESSGRRWHAIGAE